MAGSYGDEWLAELARSQPELLLQKAASLEWDSVSFSSMIRAFIDRAKALEAPGNGRDLDMALEIKTAVQQACKLSTKEGRQGEARERLAELADAFGVRATAARAFDIMAPKEKNGGATDAQGPKAFPSQKWTEGIRKTEMPLGRW